MTTPKGTNDAHSLMYLMDSKMFKKSSTSIPTLMLKQFRKNAIIDYRQFRWNLTKYDHIYFTLKNLATGHCLMSLNLTI